MASVASYQEVLVSSGQQQKGQVTKYYLFFPSAHRECALVFTVRYMYLNQLVQGKDIVPPVVDSSDYMYFFSQSGLVFSHFLDDEIRASSPSLGDRFRVQKRV